MFEDLFTITELKLNETPECHPTAWGLRSLLIKPVSSKPEVWRLHQSNLWLQVLKINKKGHQFTGVQIICFPKPERLSHSYFSDFWIRFVAGEKNMKLNVNRVFRGRPHRHGLRQIWLPTSEFPIPSPQKHMENYIFCKRRRHLPVLNSWCERIYMSRLEFAFGHFALHSEGQKILRSCDIFSTCTH